METRDHYERADFDAEEEAVRKFTQTRTMHIPKHDRKLVRTLLQTEDGSFNFFAKARPEAGMLGLVPILVSTSSARAGGVKTTCIATGGVGRTQRANVPT